MSSIYTEFSVYMRYRIVNYAGCTNLRNKNKENIMNTKEIVVSIITAMVVVAMFASSAAAITVDGKVDPAGEWNSWKLADDEDSPWYNGYDLLAVWQHYDAVEDKLYFRYDTDGISGDANTAGDDDPHNVTPGDPNDQWGVGAKEQYLIALDADNDSTTGVTIRGIPGFDIILDYTGNTPEVTWFGGMTKPAGFVAEAAIKTTPPYTRVVEFSINKVSEYMDPRGYVLYGYAGTTMDENEEDPLMEPVEVLEFDFEFKGICCHNMEFNGTSWGNVKNHTWTFGDGDSEGPTAGPPGVTTHRYDHGGTYIVKLSGYNQHGLYTETTKSVYVDKGPTAKATVTPPGHIEADVTTSVKFDGSGSHSDPMGDPVRTITYLWEFSDGYPDQTTAVVTRDVTLAEGESLSATLTVNDTHCEDDVTVWVRSHPLNVPILTPAGMLALIGLLGIVGGSRILRRGRRS